MEVILLPPLEDCTNKDSSKTFGPYQSPEYIKTKFMMTAAQDTYSLGCALLQVLAQTMNGFTDNIVGSAHYYAMQFQHFLVHNFSDENQMRDAYNKFLHTILKEEHIVAFLSLNDQAFKETVMFIWRSLMPQLATCSMSSWKEHTAIPSQWGGD